MDLDQLIAKAVEDPSNEPELFDRILQATLYVHAPKKPTGMKLSLVQFRTPQGVMAIPIFTDRPKAEFAGRGNVRIISLQGRQLLSATIGATVVINPNDNWCILYPEEIRALLRGHEIGRNPANLTPSAPLELRPSRDSDPQLTEAIVTSLSSIEHALDAWLTEADDEDGGPISRYVVVVAAEAAHHERIARSLTLSLHNIGKSLERIVDVTFIEPGGRHDQWLNGNRESLIYRRTWLPGLTSGIRGSA